MARVNVYIPDPLYRRAKRASLNVSELCQRAIGEELLRRERLRALERWADGLAEQVGPASIEEIAQAEAWTDEVVAAAAGDGNPRRKSRSARTA